MRGAFKYLGLPLLAVAGAVCANLLGLRLIASSWRENVAMPLFASFVVGLAILAWDPTSLAVPDYSTLLYYPPKATAEELIYRLGGTSCIALALTALTGKRLSLAVRVLVAAVLSQSINIVLNAPEPTHHMVYTIVRYALPGVIWGWLYLRYGFFAAIVGHAGTHIWLDPAIVYSS